MMNLFSSTRPIILTFVAYYLPAYKCGGPVRSIANMVERLGDEFDFRIITSDRDSFETAPFQGITADTWMRVGKALVYYTSPRNHTVVHFSKLLRETSYDIIYFNSFFSAVFTLRPLLALRVDPRIPPKPMVVAPRGEFSVGALALKSSKKLIYCYLARITRLYNGITWQASSKHEEADIRRGLGKTACNIVVAPNVPAICKGLNEPYGGEKNDAGPLRLIFLSRISPKKNLDFALKVLSTVRVPIEFNIYGLVDDEKYWQSCQKIIHELMSSSITVHYHGVIPHDQVGQILARHHLFFLPTLGENYGHVIYEALAAGIPALISDTTPWQDLDTYGAGWVIPLNRPQRFAEIIEEHSLLTQTERIAQQTKVLNYAIRVADSSETLSANRALFVEAVDNNEKV